MRIRFVDAFTSRPFAGNPAAVVVLDGDFPDAGWMQRVAAEVNLSETAFVSPLPPGGDADFGLRWFTPVLEVALCGHATLAAAHVLAQAGRFPAPVPSSGPASGLPLPLSAPEPLSPSIPESPSPSAPEPDRLLGASGVVRFATLSGVLTATAGTGGAFTLDFPTAPLIPLQPDPGLADVLGAEVASVHHTGPNTDDLLVELSSEAAVRTLTPDLTALARLERRGVIVTAAAENPQESGYDFVSRFFGAAVGIPEDPVTGSAHTALAPFWSPRLAGRTDLTGYQASARGGLVRVALRGDRTLLTGSAVTVIDGDLLAVPPGIR